MRLGENPELVTECTTSTASTCARTAASRTLDKRAVGSSPSSSGPTRMRGSTTTSETTPASLARSPQVSSTARSWLLHTPSCATDDQRERPRRADDRRGDPQPERRGELWLECLELFDVRPRGEERTELGQIALHRVDAVDRAGAGGRQDGGEKGECEVDLHRIRFEGSRRS